MDGEEKEAPGKNLSWGIQRRRRTDRQFTLDNHTCLIKVFCYVGDGIVQDLCLCCDIASSKDLELHFLQHAIRVLLKSC